MLKNLGKYTIACGASCLLLAAANVQAADGQIEFTGSVTDNACTINTNSVNRSVELGQVRIADFGPAVGDAAGGNTFSISLDNCSTTTRKNVAIRFSGQQDAVDSTLLGLTGENQVKGVAIRINDQRTGNQVALNMPTSDYELRPQSNTFDFSAEYVRTAVDTKNSDGDITASGIGTGQVYALASFDVIYK